jgi:hypothetical protein
LTKAMSDNIRNILLSYLPPTTPSPTISITNL